MKKFISILLCVFMLVASLPLAVSAIDDDGIKTTVEISQTWYDFDGTALNEDSKYIVKRGATFNVPSNRTLIIPSTSEMIIEEGARLIVSGKLYVDGYLEVHGDLSATQIEGVGDTMCAVRFEDIAATGRDEKIDVSYYTSNTSDPYGDVSIPISSYTTVDFSKSEDLTVLVKHGTYLYVRVLIKEDEGVDKYDDAKLTVYHNNTPIQFNQNACPIRVTTAGAISFDQWPGGDESKLYNTYTITFPVDKEGYAVYGRDGEYESVELLYGQSFSFYVELDEDYDKSDYSVYLFTGSGWTDLDLNTLLTDGVQPFMPDENGFYNITNITSDYTVFVQGVMSNQIVDIFTQIFTIFQQIWNAIVKIFNQFFSGFGQA